MAAQLKRHIVIPTGVQTFDWGCHFSETRKEMQGEDVRKSNHDMRNLFLRPKQHRFLMMTAKPGSVVSVQVVRAL